MSSGVNLRTVGQHHEEEGGEMQRHESRVAALERCEAHPGVDGRPLRTPSTRSQEPNRRRHAATRRLEAGLWRAGSRKVQAGKGRTGSRRMHAIRCHVSETGGKAGDDGVQTRARGRALGGGRGREQRGGRGTSGGRGGDGTQRTRRDETGAVVPRWWCGAVRCGAVRGEALVRVVRANPATGPPAQVPERGAATEGKTGEATERVKGAAPAVVGRDGGRREDGPPASHGDPTSQRAPANARRKIQRRGSVQGKRRARKWISILTFRRRPGRDAPSPRPPRPAWSQRTRRRRPGGSRALGGARSRDGLGSGRGDGPCSPRGDSTRAFPWRSSCTARARSHRRTWSCPCGSAHRRRRP